MAQVAAVMATAIASLWGPPACRCQDELPARCGDARKAGVLACRACALDQHDSLRRACCDGFEVAEFCLSACTWGSQCHSEGCDDESKCPLPGFEPPMCTTCAYGYEGERCQSCFAGYVGWPKCHPVCDVQVHCSGHADKVVPYSVHGLVFCHCLCRNAWEFCDCSHCPAGVDRDSDCATCREAHRGAPPDCEPLPGRFPASGPRPWPAVVPPAVVASTEFEGPCRWLAGAELAGRDKELARLRQEKDELEQDGREQAQRAAALRAELAAAQAAASSAAELAARLQQEKDELGEALKRRDHQVAHLQRRVEEQQAVRDRVEHLLRAALDEGDGENKRAADPQNQG
eukprot:TRINITY_DN26264_c0_g4_i1.p2 TRINITY_DN26264_c0_g4~~TRINITY_DN26264_c0_g4_i1.p2  ORF type:complete len:371 (+),score=88.34 TRINITY_DN26264_c0_g4_i1:80-1114(+)